jgi:hypothetical protein
MIQFFRKIRQRLVSQGNTGRDLKYAIGEILLVEIGILIAHQINNWNEAKKDKALMLTHIKSISQDIKTEISEIKEVNTLLHSQIAEAENIIPFMESKERIITDSLKFILDFNAFTRTLIL